MTPEQRRKNMQHIRSKDTSIELRLRKALWHEGIRYRKNFKGLPGKPDIVLTKYKTAIFCDSSFWHGRNFETTPTMNTGMQKSAEIWNGTKKSTLSWKNSAGPFSVSGTKTSTSTWMIVFKPSKKQFSKKKASNKEPHRKLRCGFLTSVVIIV